MEGIGSTPRIIIMMIAVLMVVVRSFSVLAITRVLMVHHTVCEHHGVRRDQPEEYEETLDHNGLKGSRYIITWDFEVLTTR
jgi:hypothetical protein